MSIPRFKKAISFFLLTLKMFCDDNVLIALILLKGGKLMVYIGIDIAKYSHFASVVSSDGEVKTTCR